MVPVLVKMWNSGIRVEKSQERKELFKSWRGREGEREKPLIAEEKVDEKLKKYRLWVETLCKKTKKSED